MAAPSYANLHSNVHTDTDLDATAIEIGSGGEILFAIEVDNTQNTVSTYLKLWVAGSPTVGTTEPEFVFEVPASTRMFIPINDGHGQTIETSLHAACVTTAGTAGTTSPTSDVEVKFFTS